MINFNAIIRSLFIISLLVFTGACSDPDQEVMESVDLQTSLDTEKRAEAAKAKYYTADLDMLNESGVSGTAELTLMGDQLTVKVYATGLEPNMPHPQHIHGFMDNKQNSTCPPPSADDDGDGLVELGEGAPFYGPVLLPLYVPIDEFPIANAEGIIDYERTFTLGETEFEEEGEVISRSALSPLQNRAIVLHGMTVDGVYNPFLPVACGQIVTNQGVIGKDR